MAEAPLFLDDLLAESIRITRALFLPRPRGQLLGLLLTISPLAFRSTYASAAPLRDKMQNAYLGVIFRY